MNGNVHKTVLGKEVVQHLNQEFSVPPMEEVNKINSVLRENGIEAAIILHQDDKKRIMIRVPGRTYDFFTREQAIVN